MQYIFFKKLHYTKCILKFLHLNHLSKVSYVKNFLFALTESQIYTKLHQI